MREQLHRNVYAQGILIDHGASVPLASGALNCKPLYKARERLHGSQHSLSTAFTASQFANNFYSGHDCVNLEDQIPRFRFQISDAAKVREPIFQCNHARRNLPCQGAAATKRRGQDRGACLPFVREGDLHSRKHPCNGTCSEEGDKKMCSPRFCAV